MTNPFEVIDERLGKIETLLRELRESSGKKEPNHVADELLTVKEAATFLHLSVPTNYGLTSERQIPFMKKAKRLYFSKLELIDYLKQGRHKTVLDTDKEAEEFIKHKNRHYEN